MSQHGSRRLGGLALAGAAVALVAVAVSLAPRLLHGGTSLPPPAASRRAIAFPGCTLPVEVGGTEGQLQAGFVDTATGRFSPAHPSAVASAAANGRLVSYDPVVQQWLPFEFDLLSPDGRSYAYLRDGPVSKELHTRDLVSGRDVVLQTFDRSFYLSAWKSNGIRLGAEPNGWEYWLVDPTTGLTVHYPAHAPYPFISLPGDPGGLAFNIGGGYTSSGQPIWTIDVGQQQGSIRWTFYERSPGQRVYIYKGAWGDATDFYPSATVSDSTGMWFRDSFGRRFVWHWDATSGLARVNVSGLPAGLPNPLLLMPVGACF